MEFCTNPFRTLHIHPRSYIICCPSWFSDKNQVIVKGDYKNLWDVWNHDNFKRLRRYWLEGNKSLCDNCPLFLTQPQWIQVKRDYMREEMKDAPQVIVFANDATCNLHCWTCRSKPIIEKRQQQIFEQTENVLDTFKEGIRFFSAIGSGDPFASPAWLKILQTIDIKKFNSPEIEIFTNGVLLPKYWDSLSHIHDNIIRIKMSVDAASPEVYERTRLGGRWRDMDNAMRFISKLGRQYILNMIVQADNYTDIPLFIERAIDHNATRVNLTMLKNWPDLRGGTAAFNEADLSQPGNPEHDKFISLLERESALLNHPIVDASRIYPAGQAIIRNIQQSNIS